MSNTDKLKELEQLYGKKRAEQILDIYINSEFRTKQYMIISVIQSEILLKFKIDKKILDEPTDAHQREVKALFVYLMSDFAKIPTKIISKAESVSIRQIYRYKEKIKDYLCTPDSSYYYKANKDFIEKSKQIIEIIKTNINEKS